MNDEVISFSDYDLLCTEDTSVVLSVESPEYSSDMNSWEEESVASFIEEENKFVPPVEYLSRIQSTSLQSVAWILKVHAYYGFHPLTAYLSLNYFHRFLDSHQLQLTKDWALQLLSVACLSLAAKIEEPLVPSLLDLQVEGAKYIFQPRTICKMELLVLDVLDWRLKSITPFNFLSYFASKLDSTSTFNGFLISRATDIILSNIQEASFHAYRPSCIAAAAILYAANEIPNWSLINPEHAESWCQGLTKEKIKGCYKVMQELMNGNNRSKLPKMLPELRVTTRTRMRSSVSSLPSSLSSLSLSYKRRKIDNCLWVDDEKGNS
ncbi:hypothetical protein TanjilG_05619 [Lupinus angustifolius]|uniref:B-like cyclin n=1 Tax=Lupinus angustifolius TaxID=3871 RepID=A0A4P1QSF6_LUPAN|nr:PREDICTED: cyclin-D1-1-like [Lupinus angustifolius]OIV93916.1 hypothetical protein TanjilG_05619 [Lupinus angustifolius]